MLKKLICIFENIKSNNNVLWFVNDVTIESVDNFKYLGITFHHTGSMKHAVKVLSDQAL